MFKSLGQVLNPHCLVPPSSNGYKVKRKLALCEWLQLQKISLHFPHGINTVKEWFPIFRVIDVKSSVPTGDIWSTKIHLQHIPSTFSLANVVTVASLITQHSLELSNFDRMNAPWGNGEDASRTAETFRHLYTFPWHLYTMRSITSHWLLIIVVWHPGECRKYVTAQKGLASVILLLYISIALWKFLFHC